MTNKDAPPREWHRAVREDGGTQIENGADYLRDFNGLLADGELVRVDENCTPTAMELAQWMDSRAEFDNSRLSSTHVALCQLLLKETGLWPALYVMQTIANSADGLHRWHESATMEQLLKEAWNGETYGDGHQ